MGHSEASFEVTFIVNAVVVEVHVIKVGQRVLHLPIFVRSTTDIRPSPFSFPILFCCWQRRDNADSWQNACDLFIKVVSALRGGRPWWGRRHFVIFLLWWTVYLDVCPLNMMCRIFVSLENEIRIDLDFSLRQCNSSTCATIFHYGQI